MVKTKTLGLALNIKSLGLRINPGVYESYSSRGFSLGLTIRERNLGLVARDGHSYVEDNFYIWKFEDDSLVLFEDSSYVMWTE